MKNLASSIGSKTFSDFDVTNQFNHVFCLGDLNYRVEGEIQVCNALFNMECSRNHLSFFSFTV